MEMPQGIHQVLPVSLQAVQGTVVFLCLLVSLAFYFESTVFPLFVFSIQ